MQDIKNSIDVLIQELASDQDEVDDDASTQQELVRTSTPPQRRREPLPEVP